MSPKTCLSGLLILSQACIAPAVQGSTDPTEASASSGSATGSSTGSSSEPTTGGPTAGPDTGQTTDAPSCDDGAHNQDESDIDCGGSCTPCEGDANCGDDTDCKSGQCDGGLCFPLLRSCLELHNARPSLPDGSYPLDPDDDDANPQPFVCDMLGGGWTQILFDEFTPAPTAPWDPLTTGTCGAFAEILGPFGAGTLVTLHIDAQSVPHTELRLLGEAIIMDSWDAVPAETLSVRVDGQEVWGQFCDYTAAFQCNQEANVCGHADFPDGKILITPAALPHAADPIALEFANTLNEGVDNESWGLDKLVLFVK